MDAKYIQNRKKKDHREFVVLALWKEIGRSSPNSLQSNANRHLETNLEFYF